MIIDTRRYPHGEAIGNELPTPEKVPGYVFAGWFTEREGGEQVSPQWQVTSSCTLYAHWEVDPYYVPETDENNGNSGEGGDDNPTNGGENNSGEDNSGSGETNTNENNTTNENQETGGNSSGNIEDDNTITEVEPDNQENGGTENGTTEDSGNSGGDGTGDSSPKEPPLMR